MSHCGGCGAPRRDPQQRFCAQCGSALVPAAPAPPQHAQGAWPPQHAQGAWPPQRGPRRSAGPWVLGLSALATVVALGGGGFAAWRLVGGDDAASSPEQVSSTFDAPRERPTELFEWSASSDYVNDVEVFDDLTLVVDGEDVVALDDDAGEKWRNSFFEYETYLQRTPDDGRVVAGGGEAGGTAMVDVRSGEVLWREDGASWFANTDAGSVLTWCDEESCDRQAVVDPETGEERFELDAQDGLAVTEKAIYTLDGGELQRIDASGEAVWSVPVDYDDYGSITAVDDLVVVNHSESVDAFTADGEPAWDIPLAPEGDISYSTYRLRPDAVVLVRSSYDSVIEESEHDGSVWDTTGEVDEIDVDSSNGGSFTAVRDGDRNLVIDDSDGVVYDADTLKPVLRLAPDAAYTPVAGGVYVQEDGEIEFTSYDEKATWTLPNAAEGSVSFGDGGLAITFEDDVALYR